MSKPPAPADVPFTPVTTTGAIPAGEGRTFEVGGRLVAVEGRGNSAFATIYVNDDGNVSGRRLFNCALPLLPGFERTPQFVF